MLDSMSRLMAGNADSRNRRIVIDALREADNIVSRVIMVCQISGDALYPYMRKPVCIENAPRRLGARNAPRRAHL